MVLYDTSPKYCPEAYNNFYQGSPIDHGTHVPLPVAQSSAKIAHNDACTTGLV